MSKQSHTTRARTRDMTITFKLVLTSFTDFQRCAARVDGALGRQRSSQISEHHAGAEGLRDESWFVDMRDFDCFADAAPTLTPNGPGNRIQKIMLNVLRKPELALTGFYIRNADSFGHCMHLHAWISCFEQHVEPGFFLRFHLSVKVLTQSQFDSLYRQCTLTRVWCFTTLNDD